MIAVLTLSAPFAENAHSYFTLTESGSFRFQLKHAGLVQADYAVVFGDNSHTDFHEVDFARIEFSEPDSHGESLAKRRLSEGTVIAIVGLSDTDASDSGVIRLTIHN